MFPATTAAARVATLEKYFYPPIPSNPLQIAANLYKFIDLPRPGVAGAEESANVKANIYTLAAGVVDLVHAHPRDTDAIAQVIHLFFDLYLIHDPRKEHGDLCIRFLQNFSDTIDSTLTGSGADEGGQYTAIDPSNPRLTSALLSACLVKRFTGFATPPDDLSSMISETLRISRYVIKAGSFPFADPNESEVPDESFMPEEPVQESRKAQVSAISICLHLLIAGSSTMAKYLCRDSRNWKEILPALRILRQSDIWNSTAALALLDVSEFNLLYELPV
jgi:hypothetical protein